MTGIPMGPNVLLLIVFILLGTVLGRRLLAKDADLQLEGVLKNARCLYGY